MSSEIVAAVDDGISERSSGSDTPDEDLKALGWILPLGIGVTEGIGALDLLGLGAVENPKVQVDLRDGNHHTRYLIPPGRGHQYITELNPTSQFVKDKLEHMREPSVMLLRGCDQLSLQSDFHFERFKTLTVLEISGFTNLTTFPDQAISELTQLQHLNLSHLPIQQLQDDFFSNLANLRSLILRGCSDLQSLPEFPELKALECLDLSHLLIETLPEGCFVKLLNLRRVILRGCSNLRCLPSTEPMQGLEALDLSHCISLPELESMQFLQPTLERLDLSCTAFQFTPDIRTYRAVTHLFLRDAKVTHLMPFDPWRLEVLDLSGAHYVKDLDQLKESEHLVALDLSRTGIESVDFISDVVHLRYLILRECTMLVRLPALERLTELEVLDVSGCEMLGDLPEDLSNLGNLKELNLSGCSRLGELREGLFDQMSCLEKLDLSKTNIGNQIPSVASLTNLRTLNLSHTTVDTVPGSSNLVNLKEFFYGSGEFASTGDHSDRMENLRLEGKFSKANELHLVSSFAPIGYYLSSSDCSGSDFDIFKYKFDHLVDLFSTIQENSKPTRDHTTNSDTTANTVSKDVTSTTAACIDSSNNSDATDCSDNEDVNATTNGACIDSANNSDTTDCSVNEDVNATTNVATTNIFSNKTLQRNYESMLTDLRYIRDNADLLESSRHCTSAGELLRELVSATDSNRSAYDFPPDSTNLIQLLRTVAKLKLLVPPKQVDALEKKEKGNKRKKVKFTSRRRAGDERYYNILHRDIDINEPGMLHLTRSYDTLTDIQKNCLLYFSALPHDSRYLNIKERTIIQLWYGEGFIDPTHEANLDPASCSNQVLLQVSTSKEMGIPNTIEEIGKQILIVLKEKRFIDQYRPDNDLSVYWNMEEYAHSFVKAQAKAEQFFYFNHENRKLTPHLTGSKRACLLRSREHYPSSCSLWESYTDSSEKLQRFKTIRTLFNVDETLVNIRPEWFCKMRNLSVLHIGRWNYDFRDYFPPDSEVSDVHIEVADLKFLEELKNMKQLRLLSLEGFSSFTKLPDVVCKLTNLKILNLRGCSYLEVLPDGIGSLKNLTHLDLTNCHVISKLPKGIMFLSKLEVLKGFVISYQIGGRQHKNACTLQDLVNLESLRTLKLCVNRHVFPDSRDVQALKRMKNLYNLKIRWERNYDKDPASQDVVEEKASRNSRFQQLKCWEKPRRQQDTEEQLRSNGLSNLRKLVLCCSPFLNAPNGLDPSEMTKLEKLSIVGGELKTLARDNQNTWNAKTLRLSYLQNLDMDWKELRHIFPNMTSFEKYDCEIRNCPIDYDWSIEMEEGSEDV